MNAIGYVRVSTHWQAEEGISLDLQRAKIEAYCNLHDWVLTEVIADEGISAKNLKRPGMQKLLAKVDTGQVAAIVVYKLDRLSRRTRDILELVERFDRADVGFHSIQESLDTKSAIGRFVLRTLASLAEMERDLISERTTDAMQHLKASGKVYCRPVFNDIAILTRMQQEHSQGVSYHGIADGLNADHVPTVRGGQWRANTVRQLLLRAHQGQRRRVA